MKDETESKITGKKRRSASITPTFIYLDDEDGGDAGKQTKPKLPPSKKQRCVYISLVVVESFNNNLVVDCIIVSTCSRPISSW